MCNIFQQILSLSSKKIAPGGAIFIWLKFYYVFWFEFLSATRANGFSWNNGLREAVVTDAFLFLSTFFVQVLNTSYKS